MSQLITENYDQDKTHVAVSSPKINSRGRWEFFVFQNQGYRAKSKLKVEIPRKNVAIIDFDAVYGD
ncbi:MAG: hypothetical protein HQ580_19225 [Planctomycetes bacterium]|nr:hypothetical protein [Planctomycetota bacterium]